MNKHKYKTGDFAIWGYNSKVLVCDNCEGLDDRYNIYDIGRKIYFTCVQLQGPWLEKNELPKLEKEIYTPGKICQQISLEKATEERLLATILIAKGYTPNESIEVVERLFDKDSWPSKDKEK